MGGQTGLNTALSLAKMGVLDAHGVELIVRRESIDKAEDRELFQEAMTKIGLESARGRIAHSMDEAWEVMEETGLPAIIRPSFTLAGTGGVAYNRENLKIYPPRHRRVSNFGSFGRDRSSVEGV